VTPDPDAKFIAKVQHVLVFYPEFTSQLVNPDALPGQALTPIFVCAYRILGRDLSLL
jgi:hypothetical protein